jgi:nucleotide-binding universal stress UspA family protein
MVFDTRPILVPLDGSSNAENAIAPALYLARKFGAPVRFIHVIDPDVFEGDVDVEAARRTFAGYAAEVAEREGADGVSHDIVVTTGHAARGVIEASREAQAVVLASHGRGGVGAAVFGSVADKIVRGAERPTFVIPIGAEATIGSGPIAVALDGSEKAEAGLAAARELASVLGLKVALVRGYSIPPPVGIEFVAYPVDLSASMKDATEAYLKQVAQPGEDLYAVMAPPVDAIEEAANRCGAGLVVMTSHGKGFAQRIALGSVTDRAMHRLKRPMLIVPVAD